jgi:hypothetical protein
VTLGKHTPSDRARGGAGSQGQHRQGSRRTFGSLSNDADNARH